MKSTSIKTLLHALLIFIGLLSLNAQAGVEITYIHNDALGSPVAGTDEQGNVKWRSHYQPYGEELLGERQLFGVRSGYTGHRDDPETGLTYMGARYYSPTLGRFMGVDPAGVSESNLHSFNRYAYSYNNPYRYVDPDGRAGVAAAEIFVMSVLGVGACAATQPCSERLAKGTAALVKGFQGVFSESEEDGDTERSTDDPVDLEEDLAGKEKLGDFSNGGGKDISGEMNDPRFGPDGTHDKLRGSHTHPDGTVTEVHADRNRKTGELSNTKFKTGADNRKSRR